MSTLKDYLEQVDCGWCGHSATWVGPLHSSMEYQTNRKVYSGIRLAART